jgi:hypothetical protein
MHIQYGLSLTLVPLKVFLYLYSLTPLWFPHLSQRILFAAVVLWSLLKLSMASQSGHVMDCSLSLQVVVHTALRCDFKFLPLAIKTYCLAWIRYLLVTPLLKEALFSNHKIQVLQPFPMSIHGFHFLVYLFPLSNLLLALISSILYQAPNLVVTSATHVGSVLNPITAISSSSQSHSTSLSSFFDGFERLDKPSLSTLAQSHSIYISQNTTIQKLQLLITKHLTDG